MYDEIKEILDELENYWERDIQLDEIKLIRNYITNLQQENERLKEQANENKVIVEYAIKPSFTTRKLKEYKQENERLKELYKREKQEKEDYKSRCKKASDKIQYIIDYGFDYDGFNTIESLKALIDMLVDYARESKNILQNGGKQ